MSDLIAWLEGAPWPDALALLFLQNFAIFGLAWCGGTRLSRRFSRRRVALTPLAVTELEVCLACINVVSNTLITFAGWILWKAGVVRFRTDCGLLAVCDVVILIFVMDLALYGLHRLAHSRWFYPWLHRLHHTQTRPRALTLFIMHPAETLAFGGLWLVIIALWPCSWAGLSVYLVLNVVSGTLGHLGVEPFPDAWLRWPLVRWVAGGSFHAQHHQDVQHNYGFYTLIWDRLFGSIRPDYEDSFGQIPTWAESVPPGDLPGDQSAH
ncbi:MAG: sterol desaturase family protein [Planctomycetes bacterium]|nr:sterol desaturase family protein [Planctomycetota bacterium]